MIDRYTPGQGCECHAHSEAECGCDVDWTPIEVYELREQRDRLERERDEARESLKEIAIQLVKEECRASFNLDTCNLYKGLLIELHNDINVIHSGNAIAKLNRMFKEENYN